MVREHTVQYRTHKWTVSETNTHPAPPAALQKCIRRSSNSYVSAQVHYGPDDADVYVSVLWEKNANRKARKEKRLRMCFTTSLPEVNGCEFLFWPFAWTAVPTPHSMAFPLLDRVTA